MDIVVKRLHRHQHNVDPKRHADAGSSACALIGSVVGIELLRSASSLGEAEQVLGEAALYARMTSCVRLWDLGKAVAGGNVVDTLRVAASNKGARVWMTATEQVTDAAGVTAALAECVPQCLLVTAVPKSAEMKPGLTGNTFLLAALPDGFHVVDTHEHPAYHPSGVVHAFVPGTLRY